ncbi:MAG: DUF6702 family protein [Gemmataceae bacterium]
MLVIPLRLLTTGMVCVVALVCGTPHIHAHPFHASIAEAEWNPKTKKLEIALWVHPVDLEKALNRATKQQIDLDKTANLDGHITAYLKKVVSVKTAKGKSKQLEWVGKEIKLKGAWLYFQFSLEGGPVGTKISNRIFFELLPDQENTITFRDRGNKRRRSVTCTRTQPEIVFRWDVPNK